MEGLNILKLELLKQKELIENMSGTVVVANNNPSPSEITEGIKTIQSADMTKATATEGDVASGKTFYASNNVLKTGTSKICEEKANAIFMPVENVRTYDLQLEYEIPNSVKVIKNAAFRNNKNKVKITLHNGIEEIEENAFLSTSEFDFVGFSQMLNLKKIGKSAFSVSKLGGVDLGLLPNSVEEIEDLAFCDAQSMSVEFRFPDQLKKLGNNVFKCSTTRYQNSLDLSNFTLQTTGEGTFYYNFFDCDFVPSATIKTIGKYFNYNGGFNNIIIPATVDLLDDYCFGAEEAKGVDYFYVKSITFLSEIPPQIGIGALAKQNAQRDFKIYVPDSAVEIYKQVENLQTFAHQIYPISAK